MAGRLKIWNASTGAWEYVPGTSGMAVAGGQYSGSAVTANTTFGKRDLSTTDDGQASFMDNANDQLVVPAGLGGIYVCTLRVITPTALVGTANVRIGIAYDGVSPAGTFGVIAGSTTGGLAISDIVELAAGQTIQGWAAAGSGVSAGTFLNILRIARIGTEWLP